jgi:glycerophosphoryl diester phosphodiesterase
MGIDIWQGALDEEAKVKRLLDNGIDVNVWTVDSMETAEKLISWGVSYITSNILE